MMEQFFAEIAVFGASRFRVNPVSLTNVAAHTAGKAKRHNRGTFAPLWALSEGSHIAPMVFPPFSGAPHPVHASRFPAYVTMAGS